MPTLANVRQSNTVRPVTALIYGVHGVGKSSLASQAPDPIFIQTEDGLGSIDAPTFGVLKSFEDVMEAIGSLRTDKHDFKTVAVDSADWLEPLIWSAVAAANGWASIEAPGYGKGYVAATEAWRDFMEELTALRDERNMTVIVLAHAEIKKFESPENEPYDRYVIKLHQRASALLQERFDCVLFANYRISTVKSDVGFNKKVVRGVSGGDRILYTVERPAYLAKNRYAMPDSIPMSWDAIAEYVPYYKTIAT